MPSPNPAHPVAATRIDLFLVGARGQVGSALRRRLAARQDDLRDALGLDLRLRLAWDRRGMAAHADGLAPDRLEQAIAERDDARLEASIAELLHRGDAPLLVVDCTASDAVADRYPDWLGAGIAVVTANKRANARSLAFYRRLQGLAQAHGAPYRYETTVGAAIPLLGPLRDLALRGERVHALTGVLSGSLSFLLDRLPAHVPFETALAEAVALGYTEPDPEDDLRAHDLRRKLVVLAREAGFSLEPEDIGVTPFPTTGWDERLAAVRATGERWAMLAHVDANGARIGLERVPGDSAFAHLAAGENLVRIRTDLQDDRPLWLRGPGAGPEVTAAGVLSDVIAAARSLADSAQARRARKAAA